MASAPQLTIAVETPRASNNNRTDAAAASSDNHHNDSTAPPPPSPNKPTASKAAATSSSGHGWLHLSLYGYALLTCGLVVMAVSFDYSASLAFYISANAFWYRQPRLGSANHDALMRDNNNLNASLTELLEWSFAHTYTVESKDQLMKIGDPYAGMRPAADQIGVQWSTGGGVQCGGAKNIHRMVLNIFEFEAWGTQIGRYNDEWGTHSFVNVRDPQSGKWIIHDSYYGYTVRHRSTMEYMDYRDYLRAVEQNDLADIFYDCVPNERRSHRTLFLQGYDPNPATQPVCPLNETCFGVLPRPAHHLRLRAEPGMWVEPEAVSRVDAIADYYGSNLYWVHPLLYIVFSCLLSALMWHRQQLYALAYARLHKSLPEVPNSPHPMVSIV